MNSRINQIFFYEDTFEYVFKIINPLYSDFYKNVS